MNYLSFQSPTGFTHKISLAAAYDKRNDPKGNFGIHGVHIYFSVEKDQKGITFSVSTGWHLPHIDRTGWQDFMEEPMAFGVDYHKPHGSEDDYYTEHCEITGGKCWGGGSACLGEEFLAVLVEQGSDGLFKRMERQFALWCGE